MLQNNLDIRVITEENKADACKPPILRGQNNRRLHRRGGVAHHIVVVGRRAVTL